MEVVHLSAFLFFFCKQHLSTCTLDGHAVVVDTCQLLRHATQRPGVISISRCLFLVAIAFNAVFLSCLQLFFTSLSKSLYTVFSAHCLALVRAWSRLFSVSFLLSMRLQVLTNIHCSKFVPRLRTNTVSTLLFTLELNDAHWSSIDKSICRVLNRFDSSNRNPFAVASSLKFSVHRHLLAFSWLFSSV